LINTSGAPVPPAGATLSGLTLNPASVNGGSASVGTVTLSASAQAATAVQLTSSNTAATVPASVTVAAGATTANFNISTAQVTSTTSATVTGTLNSISRTATLTISPVAPSADTVSIGRAEYVVSKKNLRIEATSSRSTATLQVFVTSTGELVGTLANNGGGKFSGQFNWSTNPQNVTVRSNFGGTKSSAVTAK
jgi:hypothetical protein